MEYKYHKSYQSKLVCFLGQPNLCSSLSMKQIINGNNGHKIPPKILITKAKWLKITMAQARAREREQEKNNENKSMKECGCVCNSNVEGKPP